MIGRATVGADGHATGLRGVFFKGRIRSVDKDHGADRAQVAGRTKRHRAVNALRSAIDPGTFSAIEGHFFAVLGEEILAKEFTHVLEHVTQPADDWVIASHRVGGLGHVDDVEHRDGYHREPQT